MGRCDLIWHAKCLDWAALLGAATQLHVTRLSDLVDNRREVNGTLKMKKNGKTNGQPTEVLTQ